ncbi:MAG: hypothetical protein PHE83_19330 [Opitutaceae bacterium]|nr:hypothetical protein [Opitutaceae bacterium]
MSDPVNEELTPVEESAFPFLQQAVVLDQARAAMAAVTEALARNAELWLGLANEVTVRGTQLPLETVDFVNRTTTFAAKAASMFQRSIEEDVLDKLIALNLNMSEAILSKDKA